MQTWNSQTAFLIGCVAATFLSVGCGSGSETPPLAPVSGMVSKGGVPVAGAIVSFLPKSGGRPSSATTQADGTFSLMYLANMPGAPIGRHKVTIEIVSVPSSDKPNAAPPPPKPPFAWPEEVEVHSGENSLQFTLPN
jgi:hypothetical protein